MSEKAKRPSEVQEAAIGAEFRVCPECGYENGFHSMFTPSREERVLNWFFICPSCSSRFDVGLKVRKD
ncbi:MAG: hypothetical protein ACYTFZ_05095 [Planctomycetota bacterium]|jgi:hypothetical protein